jgi:DNA mismatch endonuclease, patch repair protein
MPKTNLEYWGAKIARNRERDREADAALAAAGWRVLWFWEHDDPFAAAAEIEQAVRVSAAADHAAKAVGAGSAG